MSRFKYRISALLPLHPYTLTSSPLPTHLFLKLSTLSFTPTLAPINLPNLLDRALIHATCGAASRETVYALLILSFAPISQRPAHGNEASIPPSNRCQYSPLILISMAYDMGRSLGMEEKLIASLRWKDDWGKEWYTERAEDALMVSPSFFTANFLNTLIVGSGEIKVYQVCLFRLIRRR
jgi:hypothetical protein